MLKEYENIWSTLKHHHITENNLKIKPIVSNNKKDFNSTRGSRLTFYWTKKCSVHKNLEMFVET